MELRFLPTKPTRSTAAAAPLGGSGGGEEDGELVDDISGGGTNLTSNGGPYLTNNNHHPHPYHQHHHHHHLQHQQATATATTIINSNNPIGQEHLMLASMPHRRTLERSMRNLQHGQHVNGLDQQQKMMLEGDCGVTTTVGAGVGIVLGSRNNSSIRRGRRGSGSVPGSPRVGRGPSAELLQHNRSPMPIRAAASGVKRAARLGRAENMSSGSLNSIEV